MTFQPLPAAFICNVPLDPHFFEIRPLELGNYARVGSQTLEEAPAAQISWPQKVRGKVAPSRFHQDFTVTTSPVVKDGTKTEARKAPGLRCW